MKSFRVFLETVRTPERAIKLLDRIADREGGDPNELHFNHWEYKGDPDPEYHDEEHMFDYQGVKKLPIKDVVPGQGHFSYDGVHHYLSGEGDINEPVVAILHNDGVHRLQDGHHRLMAHRMLGSTHIKAHVYKTNEHYDDGDDRP
jgi:hypothetical protein